MYPFKIGTFITVLAIFLVGEFAVVTFGPYSPARRKQMLHDMPVVKQVREWRQERNVREAFETQDDGIVRRRYMGQNGEWNSPEQLREEAEQGSMIALSTLSELKNPDRYRMSLERLKRQAESGDLFSMTDYYFTSIFLRSYDDSLSAARMLEANPSAIAEWTLQARNNDQKWFSTREGQLLVARVARENMRHPKMSQENYIRVTEGNQRHLDELRTRADAGDADAKWVMERLATTPVWHLPVSQNR
jgi:hypothetical protein